MAKIIKVLSKSYLWRCIDLILVMLGTNPYSFTRLIDNIDYISHKYDIKFFIQLGNTEKIPKYCSYERFIEHKELKKKIFSSQLVVSHGGFGSIRDALWCNKPVVAVPRKPEFGESQDCQEELVRELEKKGMVTGVYDVKNLYLAIQQEKLKKVDYRHENKIPHIINNYIKKLGVV